MFYDFRVEIVRNPAIRGYDIWLTNRLPDGQHQVVEPVILTIKTLDLSEGYPRPTFQFDGPDSDKFLAAFANALADAGFKSKELENTQSQISAIRYHLEDMRTLVFKKQSQGKELR